jgi:hypothetical protein
MNYKLNFFLLLVLTSCCSKKSNTQTDILKNTNCPKDGVCTIKILKNKAITLNPENDKLEYILVDNSEKTVVQYEFKKNMEQSDYDGGYREEVIFEIDSDEYDEKLTNTELQQTKMLYGRFCNCRGQTGLYRVINGTLKCTNDGDDVNFELNFKINEVPQIINTIVVKNGRL